LTNAILYAAVRMLVGLSHILPSRLGSDLGEWLGTMAYFLSFRYRRLSLRHLGIAFGGEQSPDDLRKIARAGFAHLGRGFFETANARRILERGGENFEIVGRDHLDQALARGKGAICISGHIGCWELLAAHMARLGYPVNVVAREIRSPRLNSLVLRMRAENGIKTILRGEKSAGRRILQCFRQNELLALLVDQDTRVQGIMVDFFGRKANTPLAPAALALRAGCPILAAFINRTGRCRHRIEIHPPIELEWTGERQVDLEQCTKIFNDVIESQIRKAPDQWVWVHQRWMRDAQDGPQADESAQQEL